MSVWKKLITAVKGGATEAAQSVADSQAIRILEQEIWQANYSKMGFTILWHGSDAWSNVRRYMGR